MKRIICLLLCLVLCLQLAACGGAPNPTKVSSQATTVPTTAAPTTATPTTAAPTTVPTTAKATTAKPTTAKPTTVAPTTAAPTTAKPTTVAPTTAAPTTVKPTTVAPTTAAATTVKPTTAAATTVNPTTVAPTTAKATTVKPTTAKPTTAVPTTAKPTTAAPTTAAPTTVKPTTVIPTTVAPTTVAPTTVKPTTVAPTTVKPTTAAPTTAAPTTVKPTTAAPTTAAPTTAAPTTAAPTTAKPTIAPVYGTHTKLPYTQRYLYNQLTEQEQEWYRRIDAAVQNLENEVDMGADMTGGRHKIYFTYLRDNPEHFYLGNQVGIYSDGRGGGGLILSYSDGQTNVYYRDDGKMPQMTEQFKTNIRARKAAFDAEVQRIIATIPVNISDAEKELMIYDRLLVDMHYNLDAVNNQLWDKVAEPNWTAYGGIINKTGVCEAYSEAFQTLCYAVGINCAIVAGTADGGNHQWNAVELDGQWYACDLTYDDPINGPANTAYSHVYFNVTTQRMKNMDHIAGSDVPGPNCTGTKYGYHYFQ